MASSMIAHDLEGKLRTKDVISNENITFESLLLSSKVLNGLTKSGFQRPSPIQLKAIPLGRCGFDLIVKSKAGTGKTAVFSIISLEMIDVSKTTLQVIVLSPTREIAVQSRDVIRSIGCDIEGLKAEYFIGGTPLEEDFKNAKSCHIALGAPGRIKHLILDGHLKTNFVKLFVLDEADKLMDSSFKSDIDEIFNYLPNGKQMLVLSATYDEQLESFLTNYMLSPTHISAENNSPFLLGLRQFVMQTKSHSNKVQQMKVKQNELLQILHHVRFTQCLIFSNFHMRAESVHHFLKMNGWDCEYLSASQSQADRLKILQKLKKIEIRILSSTDLASRGIDASGVDLVVNFDIPNDPMIYLHRMGRAGRYGSHGICINIVSDNDDLVHLKNILGTIAGPNFNVPLLERIEENVDLLTVDLNSCKTITAIIPKQLDNSNTDIADKVMELKTIAGNKNRKKKSKTGKSIKLSNDESVRNRFEEEEINDEKTPQNKIDKECDQSKVIDQNQIKTQIVQDNLLNDADKNEEMSKDDLSQMDCMSILQSLAEGKIDFCSQDSEDGKKRKRATSNENSSKYKEIKEVENEVEQSKLLHKNLALYYTCTQLDKPRQPIENQAVDSIELYLKMMKEDEAKLGLADVASKSGLNSIADKDLGCHKNVMSSESCQNTHNISKIDIRKETSLQRIFELGYQYAVSPSAMHWSSYFPNQDVIQFKRNCEDEIKRLEIKGESHLYSEEVEKKGENKSEQEDNDDEYDENDYCSDDEDYNMEDYEEYYRVKQAALENQEKEDAAPNLEWVPVVEPKEAVIDNRETVTTDIDLKHGSKINRQDFYEGCYNACSEDLWQNGIQFDNIQAFDEWFKQWQNRVKQVTDYVQQNIYVDELNRYRNEKQT